MPIKRSLQLLFILIAIGFCACSYYEFEPVTVEIPDEPVSFKTQIQPILDAQCNKCHDAQTPVLTSDKAYDNLMDGNWIKANDISGSLLLNKINTGPHSGGTGLFSAEDLAFIEKWISEGAKDN